jgi:phage major head subunit gpT-like protein
MSVPFNQVSGDAQRALEQFSTEFDAALEVADPTDWSTLGLRNNSTAIKTTYPVPISAAGYVEEKGDMKLRSLYERSMTMKTKRWTDGVAEFADVLEAPDFIGWAGEPARIAREAKRHPCTLVAELLEANAQLSFYRDETLGSTDFALGLFAATHPVNVFDSSLGTFDNDLAAGDIDQDLFETVFTEFGTRKGANGKPMRLQPTHLICPPNLYQSARKFLESDMMRNSVLEGGVGSQKNTNFNTNNLWKGTVTPVQAYELTATDKIYFVCAGAAAYPWIVQDGGTPEEIRFDKDSDFYKTTLKMGLRYRMLMAAAPALPHAIIRVTLS